MTQVDDSEQIQHLVEPMSRAAFAAATRRARFRYGAALAVVLVLLVSWFLVTVAHGEISHVTLRTATAAPSPIPAQPISPTLTVAWQSPDATALGAPFYGGTVVTYSANTVSGRDARSGTVRWSFTRSDRAVCSAVQEAGRTMAFFSAKGDCDQLTILDTDSGARLVERTLFDDGHLVLGTPGIVPSPDSVLLITESLVRAIRFNDGLNQFVYIAPSTCSNLRAVRGSKGVLISQHCTDGDYLLLRDPTASDSTDAKNNPVRWRIRSNGAVPLSADSFVAALDPTDRHLVRYDESNGAVLGRTELSPSPSPLVRVLQTPGDDNELIWIGEYTYSVTVAGDTQLWSIPASTLPTFSGPATPQGQGDTSTLALPVTRGISLLDPHTGATTGTYEVATPPADSRVIRLGSGFLVGAGSTTVYR